jgi:Flp pilus assembly protein TadG
MIIRRTPLLRRFRREAEGVTLVEFGMIAPVLLLLVMGVAELGLMMAAQGVLENAVFSGSRSGKTGYKDVGKTQQEMILAAIKKAASSYIDETKVTLNSTAYDDFDKIPEPFSDTNKNGRYDNGESYSDLNENGKYDMSSGTTGYGAGGQIVVYTASYDWKLFTPMLSGLIGTNGVVPLKARVVLKNEPYE